ncbi:MAG: BlaI/MecI/CopY family transcriptional regulator [Ruminococcaceae bacterium]|nr:BlaI/MecI/CopY family transcriptional regulator [Oscillospiraceae bacterium]
MEQVTAAEWSVLECLWEEAPRTGRAAVEYLEASVGWSRSTTLTMLRRMTEKGLIACQVQDGVNRYTPLVSREAVSHSQTRSFLDRVYHGSIGMMLSAFTKKEALTRAQIDELYEILKEAKPHD